jgi:hypothetical protein
MLQTLTDTVRSTIRGARRRDIERFIHHYYFPQSLRKKIAARLKLSDPHAAEHALLGLREYFLLCLDGRDMVLGMPSKAVDIAWHEFILYTQDYVEFCRKAFGSYLHHIPDDGPSEGDGFLASGAGREWMNLGSTWMLSCLRSRQDPRSPTEIPLLFAIDADLRLTDGRTFSLGDLAALPIPPGFLETSPGRYRYIGRVRRRKTGTASQGTGGCGGLGCGGGLGDGAGGGGGGADGGGGGGCGGGN